MELQRTNDSCSNVRRDDHNGAKSQHTMPGQQSFENITIRENSAAHIGNVYQCAHNDDLKEAQKCHQAFKTSTYERHKNRNPLRADGTCLWVLTHPHYEKWRQSKQHALLWISADPGCGKSVLSKSLIDQDLRPDQKESICYFFFKDNDDQDNLNTALCALLHQLFSQQFNLIHHAIPAWEKNGEMICKETLEMWKILRQAAADPQAKPVFCVLDALDECRNEDRRQLIELLCDLYKETREAHAQCALKFLVTSRPYDNVQQWFIKTTIQWPQIRLYGEHENKNIQEEISSVIKKRVKTLADELPISDATSAQLETQLLNMRNRTYLWLDLAMAEVRQNYLDSPWPNKVVLQTLPSSVEDAYKRLLRRINTAQEPIARRVLLIIVGARRPLTIAEMAWALGSAQTYDEDGSSIDPANEIHLKAHVRGWCGLFVFIEGGELFLVHQTAKEFLLSSDALRENGIDDWRSCFGPRYVNKFMTNICMTYLLKAPIPDEDLLEQYRFNRKDCLWKYCADFWASHSQDESFFDDHKTLAKALTLYSFKNARFVWFYIAPLLGWGVCRTPLFHLEIQHAAALNNHAAFLKKLWEKNRFDLEAHDSRGRTALVCAAEKGHHTVIQTLLEAGAEVNAGDGVAGHAIYEASHKGHVQVVQTLLNSGAEVNVTEGDTGPLHAAAVKGHAEVVRLLLEAGAKPNSRASASPEYLAGTPLQNAIWRGHAEVVRVLDMWLFQDDDERQKVQALRSAIFREDLNEVSKMFFQMDEPSILARLRTLDLPNFHEVTKRLVRYTLGKTYGKWTYLNIRQLQTCPTSRS